MSKSGCSKTIFWLFFMLIIVPSGCGIITSILFPATGRWSTGKSYEKFQTYFPTKYTFPIKEDFCIENSKQCFYYCESGTCDKNQLSLPVKLEGDASKKRLIEVSDFIYNSLPNKKINLVFVVKGSDLKLSRMYNLKDKYYIFATARLKEKNKPSSQEKTSLDDIEVSELFWNKDEFKYLLSKLNKNLERKEDILIGAWYVGPLYILIRSKEPNIKGEYGYRFEYFNRRGKGYMSEGWSSNKKKNEFILNQIHTRRIEDHSVKCELNKCGDLINVRSGSILPNILYLEGLLD